MLSVIDLKKTYGNTKALNGVSFEVEPGKIFGLLGPNGAGKTTTIRISLGIIDADSGSVLFKGQKLTIPMKDSLAYLPEERGLYRKSKVIDVLVYFGGLRNIPPPEARKRAMDWLRRLELAGVANHKVDELSKGMQQKVQLISCLIHDPDLLILDEPFSGLDPVNQVEIKDLIRELKSKGKTIIFSTHQMEQAEKLCDQICLISSGRVVVYGDLGEVRRKYGSDTIHMEFEGDPSKLRQLDTMAAMDLYENYAEVKTRDGITRHEFLKQAVSLVDVTKFSVQEASLNSIFIDAVKVDRNGGDDVA